MYIHIYMLIAVITLTIKIHSGTATERGGEFHVRYHLDSILSLCHNTLDDVASGLGIVHLDRVCLIGVGGAVDNHIATGSTAGGSPANSYGSSPTWLSLDIRGRARGDCRR